jgi:AcrR family transcriptional regulator
MARVGLTGDRLARAGAELADETGFEQVTVSALARRFGVQVASLYSHVRNSADLKTRIATVALTELADQAANAVAGRAGRDALSALANTYRTYAHHHPGRYTASRYTPPSTPSGATEYMGAGRRHSELMRAVLRGYDLGEPAQTDAVRLLGSVIHGYATLELAGTFSYSAPASDDSWPRILDALDSLLRNWPERHRS